MNPKSGQGNYQSFRHTVETYLNTAQLSFEIKETQGEKDALTWAKETDTHMVIACGGDGTVMEVISGLIEGKQDIPVAVIPAGTGNLLARSLGIPLETTEALEVALQGVSVHLDVGYLSSHQRYFTVIGGIGWVARMIADAPREAKDRLGMLAYVYSGFKHLFKLRNTTLQLTLDGKSQQVRAHTLMLLNVGELSNTRLKFGDVNPHDGLMQVAILRTSSIGKLVHLVYRIFWHGSQEAEGLQVFPAKKVALKTPAPMRLQIDGDVIGTTPLEAEIIPDAILIRVPGSYAKSKKLKMIETPFAQANEAAPSN